MTVPVQRTCLGDIVHCTCIITTPGKAANVVTVVKFRVGLFQTGYVIKYGLFLKLVEITSLDKTGCCVLVIYM